MNCIDQESISTIKEHLEESYYKKLEQLMKETYK